MRLVSYNIQYGLGKDGRFDLARIAAEARGADVIALQEVERATRRTGFADQPQEIARLLPEYHWVYGPGLDLDASTVDASGRPVQRRRQFGNMLLSLRAILSSRNHMLPKFGTPAQFSLQRAALEGVVETRRGALRVYSIHLSHLGDGERSAQVDHILSVHAAAPSGGGHWTGAHNESWTEGLKPPAMPREAVLMGDFNLTPDSPLYDRIVGPLSPEYGRMNNLEGFADTWVAAGNVERDGVTCDVHDPARAKRIDYCFASTALLPHLRAARIDMHAQGSDHQPIWVEFDL